MVLLPYQRTNLEKLKEALKDHNSITIVGKPNTGRSTVVEQLKDGKNTLIKIVPRNNAKTYCSDILHAIKEIDSIKKTERVFKFGISFAWNFFSITINPETKDLYGLEKYILRKLNKALYFNSIIVEIKNPDQIDDGTKDIINKLFKQKKRRLFKKKLLKIEIVHTQNEASEYPIYFESLSYDITVFSSTLKTLNLNPDIKLSDNVLDFIFKNSDGNIGILTTIINDLNTNAIDSDLKLLDSNSTIKKLINTTISSSGFSDNLYDILSILAISDKYFNSNDLSFLLQKELNLVEYYLDYAVQHRFLNNEDEYYKILFGIITAIYSRVEENKRIDIYNNIVRLISTYYPDVYEEKYSFAALAGKRNAKIFLLQSIMKKIRENVCFEQTTRSHILSDQEEKLINCYYDAWCKSNNNLYSEAIKIVDSVFNTYNIASPIRQEFQLIKSQSLIKSIDKHDRTEAINVLNYNEIDNNIDEYLKYRIETRKIAALLHNGEYKKARNQSDILINRLISFVEDTRSPGIEYYLNVIYRKYCNTHTYETSIGPINKSVDFFSKSKKYIRETYIALNNALALNLINGNEKDARSNIEKIFQLQERHFNIRFPRSEIFENNKLIFQFLYDPIMPSEKIVYGYKSLYEISQELADHILIASNYAILLAVTDNLDSAIDVLTTEYNKLKNTIDSEGIYQYRIYSNYAICLFLKDNTKRDSALTILKAIKLPCGDVHNKDREKELRLIIETIENISVCNQAIEWIKAYQKNVDTPRNYYRLYEYGFVFTTLFDWDDE